MKRGRGRKKERRRAWFGFSMYKYSTPYTGTVRSTYIYVYMLQKTAMFGPINDSILVKAFLPLDKSYIFAKRKLAILIYTIEIA